MLDAPNSYQPQEINGIEIRGWSTYETHDHSDSYPRSKYAWVRNTFGEIPRTNEKYEAFTIHESLQLRDKLIESTRQLTSLAEYMVHNEKWDFFLVAYAGPHRGGHKFWDSADLKGEPDQEGLDEFRESLHKIYIECDKSIGSIVNNMGENAEIMIFSLHGMGANTSRDEILPEMLGRILSNGKGKENKFNSKKILHRLRKNIPSTWRYEVKHRLPVILQDRLGLFWRMGDVNWQDTQAFCLIGDTQGFIRINLKGRESMGIVEPGDEYEKLIRKITEGLFTYLDADTEEPIVQEIKQSRDIFPPGPSLDKLPDLIVKWSDMPANKHRQVISRRYGTIEWPTPGKNPDGRSGNHRGQGFLIASGAGFVPGSTIRNGHILDLAPTVLQLLGIEKYPEMIGESLVQIPAI